MGPKKKAKTTIPHLRRQSTRLQAVHSETQSDRVAHSLPSVDEPLLSVNRMVESSPSIDCPSQPSLSSQQETQPSTSSQMGGQLSTHMEMSRETEPCTSVPIAPSSKAENVDSCSDIGDRFVVVVDSNGDRVKRPLHSIPNIWHLPEGERIEIELNLLGQPIKKQDSKVVRFGGPIARSNKLVPIIYKDWRSVPKTVKEEALGLINKHRNESKFIEKIVQDVSRMANDHLYLYVAEHPVGLKPHVENVKWRLSVGTKDIRMMGIFGVGGIGKTTLAKAMYNSIAFEFEASCFLLIDSDTWNQVNRLVHLQKTLLSKILENCRSLKVDNIDTGKYMIERRLHSKRVLLILDGVDHLDRLKNLVGARNWFGEGSRIIITTRNQHLLTAHGVDSTYEMTGLNQDDAFQLFCWHAFKSEKPVDGYGEFVEQIINYAGSLSLVLIVLGSDLYGRTKKEWESALDQYRQIPHQDIQKLLKTSYDRLSENEKNEKCLISASNGELQMHDLLRDMGREVVRQESPKNPGECSRLFFHKDVRKVLEDDIGTYRVEAAIVAYFPNGADIIHLSPKAFKNMKRLRVFGCWNAHFSGEPNCLPNSISVLDWPNYPLQSMPSEFHGDELFILCMPGSRIQEIQKFKNLMVMNFGGCDFLTKFSNISSCPNLKEIDLCSCENLVEVHDSVGLILDKLVKLRLRGCFNLKSFPRRLKLRSLELLDLCHCSSLQNFPEIECEMEHLKDVCLSGTAIEELPSSTRYLTRLLTLFLSCSENLKRLPSSIHQLRSLGQSFLNDCPNIISFGMEEEEVHNGQPTPYVVSTSWKNEASLGVELFPLPPPTKSTNSLNLILSDSGLSKSNFFGPFHFFPNLSYLNLSGSDIVSIPSSIKRYVGLWQLVLNDCKQLQEIKEFPPNLKMAKARGCISLESLPEISKEFNFPWLRWIDLARCYKVNMGNWISNPAWNGAAMIFPGNKIPDWFSHCKEITSNSHRCEFDIKVAPPYNLDDIIGIAFYNSMIFKRYGIHLLYKQHDEQNAKDHENVDVHLDAPIEDIGNLANPVDHGSQLCKRHHVDLDDDEDDHNIAPNLYTQQRKPASTLDIKLRFVLDIDRDG
ncbi:disease resistance protein Roq1-like [Carya illinoinensis]|uniref:disease resistance protein Roq1-like n=1 Tax=Carya illinoinensis TaxID=32201 RepID=UPI001C718677|nr:disease resistance protein Roq1-like [Carya illinoinensis]